MSFSTGLYSGTFKTTARMQQADLSVDTVVRLTTGERYSIDATDLGGGVLLDNGNYANLITPRSSAFVKQFDTLAQAIADASLKDGDTVNIKERTTGNGGGGVWDVVLTSAVTPNTYNIVVSTGDATLSLVLRTGVVIDPSQWGVDNSPTDSAVMQHIYDTISDNTIIECGNLDLDITGLITVTSKNGITTRGGNWSWNHTGTNLIKLAGTLNQPAFIGMKITGTGANFASQGAIGCASGVVTTDWLVERCTFSNLPFGVYYNADTGGTHTRPAAINNTFTDIVRDTVSDTSGIGNGIVFASQNFGITGGRSIGNVFTKCGRHSLYVASGGNVTSIGDTFIQHRDDGSALITSGLAACFVARNSRNVNIVAPRFEKCKDIGLSIQAVQLAAAQTFGSNVSVVSPIFDGNIAGDFEIGNDSPAVNGWINNVSITDIQIRQYGESNAIRGNILSGLGITVDGIKIEADLSLGATSLVDIIRIEDTATALTQFNDITIRNITGQDAGATSRGVHVDAGLLDGTIDASLNLEEIKFGTSSVIFESGVTPVNPNYLKLLGGRPVLGTAFTGAFTNKDAEINRVDKYAGKKIFSLSGGLVKPLYATGSLSTDTWVDGAGTVVHTPV